MTLSSHSRRLARPLAYVVAVAAIAAPLAQASTSAGFVTEHSVSQNRIDLRNAYALPDAWQHRFLTENSAGASGYRFITENSASQNRLYRPFARATASNGGFDWIAMAIGAAGTLSLTLFTTAAVVAVRRTRARVAPAS